MPVILYPKRRKVSQIHYLSGAIYVDNSNANDSLYYVYTDNQGSVIAMTDEGGTVKRKYAYDPWGARRNPTNWNEADNLSNLITNRGYTGHEHLDAFGIINMNGRIYDPATAQFMNPDPFVQSPGDWLNYNRYSYCFGNPLIYTDPSGYQLLPMDEGRAVDAYGSWSTGVDFMTDYKNQKGAGGGGGSYTYNWDNGNYYNQNGDIVNYWEVYHNYILPNVANGNEFDYIYRHNTEVGGISGDYIDGFKLNGVIYEFSKPVKYGEKLGGNLLLGHGGYSGDNIFAETWMHYQIGGGKPLIVNSSSLNFSFVSQQNLNKDGSVNLANPKIFGLNALSGTALALGSITLKSQGNNRYKIEPDLYDFDIRWKNGFTFRNFATFGAGLLHGPVIDNIPIPLIFNGGLPIFGPSVYTGSGKFTIYFEGTVYIKP